MSANGINSISEFLLHAGTEYKVFDLGRRLEPTDSQTFLEIENWDTTIDEAVRDNQSQQKLLELSLELTLALPFLVIKNQIMLVLYNVASWPSQKITWN